MSCLYQRVLHVFLCMLSPAPLSQGKKVKLAGVICILLSVCLYMLTLEKQQVKICLHDATGCQILPREL